MQLNSKDVNLLSCLALASAGLALTIKFAGYMREKYKKYQNQPVLNLSDVLHKRNQKDLIVKAQIIKAPTYTLNQPVYANQKYFCQPSDMPIIHFVTHQYRWTNSHCKIADVQLGSKCTKQIPHFGQILNDIFTVQKKFVPQPLGFFGKIHEWISFFFESVRSVFEKKNIVAENEYRKPGFMGPCIGSITYTVSLVFGIPIVFSCKIDDNGNIIPEFTAASKQFIVQRVFAYKFLTQLLAFSTGVLVLILFRHCFPSFKKLIAKYLFYKKHEEMVVYNPYEVSDNQRCVICMDKARNVLLLDCKHLIICNQCVQQIRVCPICKQEIHQTKIIYSV